jgi:hypothetical protein
VVVLEIVSSVDYFIIDSLAVFTVHRRLAVSSWSCVCARVIVPRTLAGSVHTAFTVRYNREFTARDYYRTPYQINILSHRDLPPLT